MAVRASARRAGFSLTELLIALAIVSILVAVALPSYRSHMANVRRGVARSSLVQAAQWLERVATATGRYPAASDIPTGLFKVDGDSYRLFFATQPTTFTLDAVPAGPQSPDRCGTLSLLQSGERRITHAVPDATLDACWGR